MAKNSYNKEIRIQTIMIGSCLAVLGFFGAKVIDQGKLIVHNTATAVSMNERMDRLDFRVNNFEIIVLGIDDLEITDPNGN